MKKSLKVNSIMNVIQNMFAVIIPMVTFPYTSRVLGVNNIGKINYVNSIISYFLLIANLGVASYAGREVALVRSDRKKANKVASEIFSLNILSTLFSYLLLTGVILGIDKFEPYRLLLAITSCNIITNVLSTSWVFGVYEEYSYVTIRNILSQTIFVYLLFMSIHQAEDYILYAILTQGISLGTCICDTIYRRKLVTLRPTFNKEIFLHFKPIILMFGISIAGSIYVNSDSTLLGYLCGDYEVGLYSVAVKIYSMVKTFLSAIAAVIIPRLVVYFGQKKEKEFKELFYKGVGIIILLVVPMTIGLEILAPDIIEVFCGQEYEGSILTLRILAWSLVFSIIAFLFMSGIMMPNGREKTIMKISMVAAIINIVANMLLIPIIKQDAAAFTTLLSEIVMFWCILKASKKYISIQSIKNPLRQSTFASIIMSIFVLLYCYYVENVWIRIIGSVIFGGFTYFLVLLFLRNAIVLDIINQIKQLCKKIVRR